MSKLVLGGHSFGAMTAIQTARVDNRVKALMTMDPWLYVPHKLILSGEYKLNVPFFAVSSQSFHPFCAQFYESWKSLKSLFENSEDPRKEHVVVNNTGHLH